MKKHELHMLNYSNGWISAFDLSGAILWKEIPKTEGHQYDIEQLRMDQDRLETDYKIAYERVMGD